MLHYAASEAVLGPRDFARVINRIFLSLNLIGRIKKKRNDVTEIVLQLEIADAIFWAGETRAEKCVCSPQATAMILIDLQTHGFFFDIFV